MPYLLPILLFAASLTFYWQSTQTTENQAITLKPCNSPPQSGMLQNKMKGISFVAPPHDFHENPMVELNELGATWIAALPYAFYSKDKPIIRTFSKGGWWGERLEGICETVRLAKEKGIKVMLKPQLWTHDHWIGDLDFETEEDWKSFEKQYAGFILGWANVADSLDVELFCVGTEIRHFAAKRVDFWVGLIDSIRLIYKGKLTYAPNWDDYDKVPFWDKLDYIGVDAYFPLLADKTPTVCKLKTAWKPMVQKLKDFSKKWNKPILFTEYGYLSHDYCADKTWELEKNLTHEGVNEQAQANAIQALLETFGAEDWWAGGFLWKWYPDHQHRPSKEGQRNGDYTPQGKKAQEVLKVLFKD